MPSLHATLHEMAILMSINLVGEALDTVFSLSGKTGRFLNAKGKKICWPIWTVCAAYWSLRNLQMELYSQAFFAGTSVFLNLYGLWSWKKKGYDEQKDK